VYVEKAGFRPISRAKDLYKLHFPRSLKLLFVVSGNLDMHKLKFLAILAKKNTQRLFEPEYSTAPPNTDGAV